MVWSGVDYLWIIVMFLSAVWTLILTAPIHCRASIGEQVMECYISPNQMKKQTHLHPGWCQSEYIFSKFRFLVNYSFKICCHAPQQTAVIWILMLQLKVDIQALLTDTVMVTLLVWPWVVWAHFVGWGCRTVAVSHAEVDEIFSVSCALCCPQISAVTHDTHWASSPSDQRVCVCVCVCVCRQAAPGWQQIGSLLLLLHSPRHTVS